MAGTRKWAVPRCRLRSGDRAVPYEPRRALRADRRRGCREGRNGTVHSTGIGGTGLLAERIGSMVGYINLEEQVDRDFSLARRKALLGRIGARLRRRDAASERLLCFDEVREISRAVGRVYRGTRPVPVEQIRGSVGRSSEFDRGFMPVRDSAEGRWKRVDRAFHRGEALPPVSLYKLGGFYFVLDGHHRVSVARYHGVECRRHVEA
jgi:hypothetical protein